MKEKCEREKNSFTAVAFPPPSFLPSFTDLLNSCKPASISACRCSAATSSASSGMTKQVLHPKLRLLLKMSLKEGEREMGGRMSEWKSLHTEIRAIDNTTLPLSPPFPPPYLYM